MPLNFSDFTMARAKIGLYAAQKQNKATVGFPGEIREFTARAITDGVPLSRKKMLERYGLSSVSTTSSPDDSKIARSAVKAIIVGDAIGNRLPFIENPHSYLVDPCSLGKTPDIATSIALAKMFPTFITSTDYDISSGMNINRNDIIKVTLQVGGDGALIMEQGEILGVVEAADPARPQFDSCESLQGQFTVNAIELLETSIPSITIDAEVCAEEYSEFYLMHPLMNDSYPITSPYGPRGGEEHQGTDWGASTGTPIYAAADGVIDKVYAWDGKTRQGNSVNIKHTGLGSGYKTKYFHMAQKPTHIKAGDLVSRGDLIGKVGNTGVGTGPHLHMELWKGSSPMDATPFIKAIQKCDDPTAPAVASTDPTSPAGTDAAEGPMVEG